MRGFVGITDFAWFSFLAARPELREVNFWRPSGARGFSAIQPGEPFFFKLKSPRSAIAGFGTFARHVVARVNSAWEAFGVANGTATFAEMDRMIRSYRADGAREHGGYEIGCTMIVEPVFFQQKDWIPQPEGWGNSIVSGKGYDLSEGEGRRIHLQCLARSVVTSPDLLFVAEQTKRYGAPQIVRPRLGQSTFRLAVADAYGRACAITNEHSEPVLEAAHIQPYAREGAHDVQNGLLLRADIHRLFDQGYVTVTKDYAFEVSRRLNDDFSNGRVYYGLHGNKIALPKDSRDRPSPKQLAWHNESVYLG